MLAVVEDRCYGKAGNDVPDAPPGRNYQHAAMGREAVEQGCSQHEGQAQTGVLDARLDGEGAAVAERYLADGAHREADGKRQEVMDEHHNEDVLHAHEEGVNVAAEGQNDHGLSYPYRQGIHQGFRSS